MKSTWVYRQLPGIVALAVMAAVFVAVRLPGHSAAETRSLASRYAFVPMSIAEPGGLPQQTIRKVNKEYAHIDAWISSVGAGISMNDLDGDGLANDLCVTDPRTDSVVVTPVPGAGTPRYAPFTLNPAPLPTNDIMAPMGCLPGDFNEDGHMDLMVYMWGRTPIIYQARTGTGPLTLSRYQPIDLVASSKAPGGRYSGPQWNTNAVAYDDFDGDGHDDIFIGNYFPDGPVLDPKADGGVEMNDSMSHGLNGGQDHFFRWTPTGWDRVDDALPEEVSLGWALGAGANDMDGDQLPELYLAHDFGPDRMLHNRSTPGKIAFSLVESGRSAVIPRSKLLGIDSFKGMGVDFGDLNGDAMYDMFVSNITTTFGIQESNFAFMSTSADQSAMRTELRSGGVPWKDESAPLNLAWSGWGWDIKIGDYDNSGENAIAQATGFVKGEVNRWPQLQELATANDGVLRHPYWWPNVRAGDDVGGSQTFKFFAPDGKGRYADLSHELGLAVPVPTRGIATGDADGDGLLDMAVARQWDAPVFYHNVSPNPGAFMGLRLCHEGTMSPVIGAQVTVTTPDGRDRVGHVDGGSGHSGKRSNEVHIGLGANVTAPVKVHLRWRDRTGTVREQDLNLTPGWHDLQLGTSAKEAM